jgi:Dolichyl-phosphate-mannose-protein mannosyltransferase
VLRFFWATREHLRVRAPTIASRWLLAALLAACIARLWVVPISSSFWVDEMATAFVVHHGAADASLRVAPQVAASIYYVLPRAAERLFGFSEWAYRLPSLLAMGLSLWFIARVAGRLLHEDAAWFTIFCCLSFRAFDYQAADARPYALGTCVVCAGMWFLIRWLDTGRWRDAVLFTGTAALVCQVHLIFWPIYLLFGGVAGVRLARRDTPASRLQALAVFGVVAASLSTVLPAALRLLREAGAHVVVGEPAAANLGSAIKLGSVTAACAVAAIIASWRGWKAARPAAGSLLIVAMWWLVDPLSLFAFSHLTGHSVFVARYLTIALPGAALAVTAAAAIFLPPNGWRPLSLALGAGVLIFMGSWTRLWPAHHNSGWRAAAQSLNEMALPAGLPVICPSPFIEARPPVWRPDYPIDSFLYSNLLVYRVPGKIYPFPFERSPEAERDAQQLWQDTLSLAPAFVLYGIGPAVISWRDWFHARAQTAGWRESEIGPFGDVWIVRFDPPADPKTSTAHW